MSENSSQKQAQPDPGARPAQTPKWRRDLPTEWARDNYTTRRDFTKFLALISGATFLGNCFFAIQRYRKRHSDYPEVAIARVGEIDVKNVKLFRYPTENDPAILIRLSDQSYVAYVQRCTHLSCPVFFEPESFRLECPCHDGAFDPTSGAVLGGPPPRPLPRILLRQRGGQIFATGIRAS